MFERAKSFILSRSRKQKTVDLDDSSHLRRTIDMSQVELSNPNIYASLRVSNADLKKSSEPRNKTTSMEDVTIRHNTLTKISRHSLQTEMAAKQKGSDSRLCAIEPYHRKSIDTTRNTTTKENKQKINNINPNVAARLAYESLERFNEKKALEQQNLAANLKNATSKNDLLKLRLTRQRTDLNLRPKNQKQKRYSGGDFIVMPNPEEYVAQINSNLNLNNNEDNNNNNNIAVDKQEISVNNENLRLYYRPAPKMGTRALYFKGPKNPIIEDAKKEAIKRDQTLLEGVQSNIRKSYDNFEFCRNQGIRRSLQETNKSVLNNSKTQYFVKSKSFIYKPTKGLQNMLQE